MKSIKFFSFFTVKQKWVVKIVVRESERIVVVLQKRDNNNNKKTQVVYAGKMRFLRWKLSCVLRGGFCKICETWRNVMRIKHAIVAHPQYTHTPCGLLVVGARLLNWHAPFSKIDLHDCAGSYTLVLCVAPQTQLLRFWKRVHVAAKKKSYNIHKNAFMVLWEKL